MEATGNQSICSVIPKTFYCIKQLVGGNFVKERLKTIIISAITTFVYVGGGSLLGAIFLLKRYGDKPDWMIFWACGLFAAMATAKDVRATMRMPPIDGSAIDMDQLRQFIEQSKK